MDRRNFLCKVTIAGTAAASVPLNAAQPAKSAAHESRTVSWKVKGFTCITCSVGLEVMLRGMNGVTRAQARYPENDVTIGFDEKLVSEKTLRDFIQVCGFTVA